MSSRRYLMIRRGVGCLGAVGGLGTLNSFLILSILASASGFDHLGVVSSFKVFVRGLLRSNFVDLCVDSSRTESILGLGQVILADADVCENIVKEEPG